MKIVQRVWELHQKDVGGLKITQVLTAEGYTTRKGKPFHFSFIYKMIKNLKDHPDLYPFLQAAA